MQCGTWKLILRCLSRLCEIIQIVTHWTTSLHYCTVHSCRPYCHCLCPEWWTSYHFDKPGCLPHLLHIRQCEACNPDPLPQLWMFYRCLIYQNVYVQIWPEYAILCPGCPPIPGLKLHPELLVSSPCQLMDLFISHPELLVGVTKPKLVISPVPVKVLPGFSIITPPLNDKALKWQINKKVPLEYECYLFPLLPLHISPPTLGRGCHKPWSWSYCLNPAAARSPSQTKSQPWESWVWNIKSCLSKLWLDILTFLESMVTGLYFESWIN